MSLPFVGRGEELSALRGLLLRARRESTPVAALISGEPGSGKSRLLRETLADVDPRRRVAVAGFEPIQPVPLAAVGDLIRRLEAVPDLGPRLQELAFGSVRAGASSALPVFEAAHRALAAFGPLVLAIDDLQWVDAQSFALVHYIVSAAEASRRPLAVIAASRPSAAVASFADGIVGLLPDDRTVKIELRGLDIKDGVRLALAIDEHMDQRSAEAVWRRAAGSPFWLEALARDGHARDAAGLISDRLRALSPDAGNLLNAIAVGARPFAHDELAAFVGWRANRLAHAVRELVGRGLAVDQHGTVRPSHDLIREAAAATAPATTRRFLHQQLAQHIERSASDDVQLLAEALDHRSAAGLPTADLAIRLVGSPHRRLLGTENLDRLSSIADAVTASPAEQLELDQGIARLATDLGERARASRHWSRVAGATTDPRLRQHAHMEAARAGYEGGDPADVHRHLAEARALPLDAVMAIELDSIEAQVRLWDENDTLGGAAAAKRAVARGRELLAAKDLGRLPPETRAVLLGVFVAAAEAAYQLEEPDECDDLGATALAIADGLDPEARLPALLQVAFAFHRFGRLREAEERYREAWEASQRLMLPRSMYEAAIYLARVLHDLGRLSEARLMAREADALQARIRPWLWGSLGRTVLHLIDLSAGVAGAMEGIRSTIAGLDSHHRIEMREAVATRLARQDGASGAARVLQELDSARAEAAALRCPVCARGLQVISAELLARIGLVDTARQALDGWVAEYRGPDYPTRRLRHARAETAIAMAACRPEAADKIIELAKAYESAGMPEEAAWARLDLGRVLHEQGDRSGATAVYKDTAALAEQIGARGVGRLAGRALRELGVRAWRRGAIPPSGDALSDLSYREREVARLVAAGSSNREVAAALVLSPKTVERHVTNILAKLGARNRTELASLLFAGSVRGSPDD